MKVVFCTTCRGRTQHLEITLPKNLSDNKNENTKFVVLDYNSQDHLIDHINGNYREYLDNGRLSIYTTNTPLLFQMAHAKNMAHRCGILEGADILCNLDADNFTGIDFDEYIVENMAPKEVPRRGTYLWARMKKGQLKRGISGRIVVTRNAFLKTGGYNEIYNTWGPDDKDFSARLNMLGYKGKEIDDAYLDSITHNDKMRFREYRHARCTSYTDDFVPETDATIANYGRVGEGIVHKNFDFSTPIVLGPIPTRIFGIGLHKTATTSLHAAFKILGFEASHWPSAHWAKAVWQEMNNQGRSLTLERHYAFSDIPFNILFKQLDAAYPGSKYVLTIRDENEWLDSVKRHFDPNANPFRTTWDSDPFTHIIHQKIYGTNDFDANIFLERYRRHNEEVINYFKGRPNDLLVMSAGESWNRLCQFLGMKIPNVPYPKLNSSKANHD